MSWLSDDEPAFDRDAGMRRFEAWRSSRERLDAWMQTATRFFVLSNAGGAVAVLSFLGTRQEVTASEILVSVTSLALFAFGVIVAGFAVMGQTTAAWRAFVSITE